MGLGLIPISDGVEIVGAMVAMAVFDSGAQGLGKGDRRIEVETINRVASTGAPWRR